MYSPPHGYHMHKRFSLKYFTPYFCLTSHGLQHTTMNKKGVLTLDINQVLTSNLLLNKHIINALFRTNLVRRYLQKLNVYIYTPAGIGGFGKIVNYQRQNQEYNRHYYHGIGHITLEEGY